LDNIVVTGGFGFIGCHLIIALLKENKKVTVIDNLSNSSTHFLADTDDDIVKNRTNWPAKFDALSFYNQDIRNRKHIFQILSHERFDTCIHLAANVSVNQSIINPEDTLMTNFVGTLNMLDACSNTDIDNFVFASTGAVYGEPKELPITEEHRLDPSTPYGSSKMAGEALLSSFVKRGKIRNGISLRFFNVYGSGQSAQYSGIITNFANRLSQGLAPIIYGDGFQTRDFIFVEDVVRAIMMASESLNTIADHVALNIATGVSTRIKDLASVMTSIYGLDLNPVYEDKRFEDIRHAKVDITKAKDILNFLPKYGLLSGLAQLLKQFDILDSATR
jgi:UDP-glucose 4-epimerase